MQTLASLPLLQTQVVEPLLVTMLATTMLDETKILFVRFKRVHTNNTKVALGFFSIMPLANNNQIFVLKGAIKEESNKSKSSFVELTKS